MKVNLESSRSLLLYFTFPFHFPIWSENNKILQSLSPIHALVLKYRLPLHVDWYPNRHLSHCILLGEYFLRNIWFLLCCNLLANNYLVISKSYFYYPPERSCIIVLVTLLNEYRWPETYSTSKKQHWHFNVLKLRKKEECISQGTELIWDSYCVIST